MPSIFQLSRELRKLVDRLWKIRKEVERAINHVDPTNPARNLLSQAGCELENVYSELDTIVRRSGSGGTDATATGRASVRGAGSGR